MYAEEMIAKIKQRARSWAEDNVNGVTGEDLLLIESLMFIGATIALEEEARYALLEARGRVKE